MGAQLSLSGSSNIYQFIRLLLKRHTFSPPSLSMRTESLYTDLILDIFAIKLNLLRQTSLSLYLCANHREIDKKLCISI